MQIRIDGDGEIREIEVDLSLETLTMRESARLEELLGEETFNRLVEGDIAPEELVKPSIIQKLLYVKLRSQIPELSLDGFDVELEELNEALTAAQEAEPGKGGGSSSG